MRLIKVHDLIIMNGSRTESYQHYLTMLSTAAFVAQYSAKIAETGKSSGAQKKSYFTLLNVEDIGSPTPEQMQAMQSNYAPLRLFPEA